jgi:hypothetical protein
MSVSDRRHSSRRLALVGALAIAAGATVPALLVTQAAAADEFIPGSATALAQGLQLAPATGGLNYAITQGVAIGGYEGSQGKAQSQTFDLGIIGTTLTAEGCDGSAPTISKDQIPQPLIVESMGQKESADKTEAGQMPPAAVGTEHVEADGTPSGYAKTTGVSLGVPGVITIEGGSSEASGRLVPDKARIAEATSTFGKVLLGGGLVELDGLTWHAVQQTGANSKIEKADGTFTIGAIKLAGQAVPFDQNSLSTVIDSLNKALAPLGTYIKLPGKVATDDGSVKLSPMVIGMANNQVGQQTLGQALGAGQPVRDALFQAMTGVSCKTSTLFLLGDIGTGPLTGAGSVALNIGGIQAGSEGIVYDNPFGDFGGDLGGPVSGGPIDLPAGGAGGMPSLSGTGGSLPSVVDSASGGPSTGGAPTVAASPVVDSRTCSSTHPSGGSCDNTPAVAVGLGALGAIFAVGVADVVLGRRRGQRLSELRL